jgi:hypothetical protein
MLLLTHEGRDIMKSITLKWKTKKVKDDSRVGMMYCFKNCEKNKN